MSKRMILKHYPLIRSNADANAMAEFDTITGMRIMEGPWLRTKKRNSKDRRKTKQSRLARRRNR